MEPIEVITWSAMWIVWSAFEAATQCIGDAGEARAGFHLSKENPDLAKQSAHKCILISAFCSLIIQSMFLMMICGVPSFFASDKN